MAHEAEQIQDLLAVSREARDEARGAVVAVTADIQQKENEVKTATSTGERDIANIEQRIKDAESLDEYAVIRELHDVAARTRADLSKHINQLEVELGELRNRKIRADAEEQRAETRLTELFEREKEERDRQQVSNAQIERAAELEKQLSELEGERAALARQIEQYAPLVEAQREATTASGSAELGKAYADQADSYKEEWQRWLICLGVAVVVALVGGVAVVLLSHPSGEASNSQIASRIAIEIIVLGLLVYTVRVTAHQFRVHRHLETVSRGKAAALLTFSRLVEGPGQAEVRAAVAVALAQAVFDSSSTGFIDASQDGVTLIERIAAPVTQRLSE